MFLLVLLCTVLSQKQAHTAGVTCVTVYDTVKTFDTSITSKDEILLECFAAKNITLQGETTFVVSGSNDASVESILSIGKVEMCILVENAPVDVVLIKIESITGSCEGPKLTMVNNPRLEQIVLISKLFENLKSVAHAVRIRGNKMLDEESISALKTYANCSECLDVQKLGECSLPKPFKSFQALDRNCSLFYGPLVLEQGVTEILYNSSEIHEFELEGCVQIERTQLKDLTFLYAFSKFKPIPYCTQFVRNNKKLCLFNLNYLNEFFKNINFFNNSEKACGECLGGRVSERYLDESANCSSVYGDLIIANFRGIPSNIANLRGIESIEGRLIITNNTGLNKFEHLHSLKKIGSQNGKEVAVILKDNADLKTLAMPSLSNINFAEDEERIELVNNPILRLENEQILAELSTAKQTTAVFVSASNASNKRERQTSNEGAVVKGINKAILLGTTALLLLNSPYTLGNFIRIRGKKRGLYLLQPQENPRLLSQTQFNSLCTECSANVHMKPIATSTSRDSIVRRVC